MSLRSITIILACLTNYRQLSQCGVGEVSSFWGTKLRHYVPANESECTRVSIDFRVGVEGYFDSGWSMKGSVEDHNRRVVEM